MKLYNKYIYILMTVVVMLVSCKKSSLDLNPPDKLSTQNFWKSESDADLALTGCYNFLYAQGGSYSTSQYEVVAWDNFSDNSYGQYNYGGGTSALSSGLSPGVFDTYNLYQSSYYVNNYTAIASINYFLANVDKVLTGDKLKQYKAEAYFLRAFNYYWLAILYGNVIITTADPFTLDYKKHMAKSTRADVLKQVEADLDLAIAGLPDAAYGNGHAVKATA